MVENMQQPAENHYIHFKCEGCSKWRPGRFGFVQCKNRYNAQSPSSDYEYIIFRCAWARLGHNSQFVQNICVILETKIDFSAIKKVCFSICIGIMWFFFCPRFENTTDCPCGHNSTS